MDCIHPRVGKGTDVRHVGVRAVAVGEGGDVPHLISGRRLQVQYELMEEGGGGGREELWRRKKDNGSGR